LSVRPGDSKEQTTAALSRRVLVADDNYDAAETLAMLLRLSGHEVYVAHSGEQALALAGSARPQVGVLDIGMPDIDAYDVARRIRREEWGHRMLLIAVTGWGQEGDKRAAGAAGFDHHLTKPMDPLELERLFAGAPAP
jgi:CheY-like chemotaxis protein